MKCANCSKNVEVDSKFCVYCGNPIIKDNITNYSKGDLIPYQEGNRWVFDVESTLSHSPTNDEDLLKYKLFILKNIAGEENINYVNNNSDSNWVEVIRD